MAKGDHFFVWRRQLGVPFQHHAIDVGDGTAVHFTDGVGGVAGPGHGTKDFVVMHTSIATVTQEGRCKIHIIEHARSLDADEVVERAISQVGRKGYHLMFDNCEHFASWCAVDREESGQIRIACERLAATSVKTMAAGTLRLASRHGAKRLLRGASGWMLVAEAAQWATEAGGHHVGLCDPKLRRNAGRAVGSMTAIGLGAIGGPIGIAVAGTLWVAGEVAGEASNRVYEQFRQQRKSP
ncbi:lecithin retinol acyltransferase family protein [Stieleria marina]|uniref:NC domain protein n=1 Tax=Stieleria marina TaxID=1930275 RepID=A0A517NMI2_9BACT|nr:NC domain protein [Planctomycetes bacterium K23_9]